MKNRYREALVLTYHGHCKLFFENGYSISIFNGYGSWTTGGYDYEKLHFGNEPAHWLEDSCKSPDCEVAVINQNNEFVTKDFTKGVGEHDEDVPDVVGNVTPDELADLIHKIKNLPKPLDKIRKEDR